MALKGNLEDFPTPQLLNLISLARKTGTLTIEGTQIAQMSFRDGKLIYASVGTNSTSLAFVLQKSGILSAEQGQIIESRMKGTGDKQLGHLLIRAGYATQRDIIQSVQTHILDAAYKIFTWADGLFSFDANSVPSSDRITVPIDLDDVILEGSRRLKEWEHLSEEIPDLDATLRFADDPDARLDKINLSVEEWRVISFVGQGNTIRQIAEAVNLSAFQIRRIVYGMMQAGLIDVIQPPRVTAARQKETEGSEEFLETQRPSVKRTVITRLIDRIRRI
jgi:hypothetical protein